MERAGARRGGVLSECKNCGRELVCDIPFETKLSDRVIRGHKSAPHGCPEEFDHYQWKVSKEETDAWFAAAEAQERKLN